MRRQQVFNPGLLLGFKRWWRHRLTIVDACGIATAERKHVHTTLMGGVEERMRPGFLEGVTARDVEDQGCRCLIGAQMQVALCADCRGAGACAYLWQKGSLLPYQGMKYVPGQGVSVDQEPTNRANGLTRDLKGRLVACEHDTRRVTRYERDGSLTVIANSFQGRRLNRPNDVVVKSDGCYYFTDPNAGLVPEQWDLTFAGVYRLTPDLGTLSLLVDTFVQPNGLAFSPDESVLYINDSRRGHIRAFDLLPTGMLAKQTDRVFADLRGSEPGVPDGMKVDREGNVYCGGSGGIWILDPQGKKLGRIVHGAPATTNLAFGGEDWKTLYFTSRSHLGAVKVKIPGMPVPPQKKERS
jgi:gluconolactonase